ncbi:MAG: GTP-binding protein [Clostridiales bacterium]|nr:GTP-binding protein [Clostridiales bacterium]
MDIPVYLITGFLESGKTSFILDTIKSREFSSGEKTLLILCEEGMEEYEEEVLKKTNTECVVMEEKEDFTPEFLSKCQMLHKPERVIVEYNGMWTSDVIMNIPMPKGWQIVQIINLVNAATFDMYLNNMRSLFMDHFTIADMVVFNRCTPDMPCASYMRNVKAVNRRVQVFFETNDGKTLDVKEELPYDMTKDTITIEDDDFGIFYIDAADDGKKYAGKTVRFKGQVYKPKNRFGKGSFVPGRFAMTCCVEDIAFVGFVTKVDKELEPVLDSLEMREWVYVEAVMRYEFHKDYKGKGPVLYAVKLERAEKPKDDLVYF